MGAELGVELMQLTERYHSFLKSQMQKLAPFFPTSEELPRFKALASEWSTDEADKNPQILNDRELVFEFAYNFSEITFERVNQIVWRGDDYFPLVEGAVNHAVEYLVTKGGILIRGEFNSEKQALLSHVSPGWQYYSVDYLGDILKTEVATSF